jgi:hypothetical protein
MSDSYVMGLDLGPPGEPTGLAVLEVPPIEAAAGAGPPADPKYHLRHIERFEPGAGYHAIVAAVAARAAPPLQKAPVVVDCTAVGRAVTDLLRHRKPAPHVVEVTVTAGQAAQRAERGGWLVPKKDLVTALQLALQARRLKVAPALAQADLLATELGGFRLRRVAVGEAEAAEWRVGRSDDLVFAVALACWYADRHPNRPPRIVPGRPMLGYLVSDRIRV